MGNRDECFQIKLGGLKMLNQKQAIKAIRKAKNVFVNTRLCEHDMAYIKGIKVDLIDQINVLVRAGVTEFNVLICSDGDIVIG